MAEELSVSVSRELSTLHDTLDTVQTEKRVLEAENTALRRRYSDAEEALAHNRLLRKKRLHVLHAEIASTLVRNYSSRAYYYFTGEIQAALQVATDCEAAVAARQNALEEQLSSVTAATREVGVSLEDDLAAKEAEVTTVSKTLTENQAATTDLKQTH